MDTSTTPLAALLRTARQKAGLSVRELEAASGVHRGNISRIERGEDRPSPENLSRLGSALGADVSELLAKAGYTSTSAEGLPSFTPYMRAKYGHLPASARRELADSFARIVAEYEPRKPAKPRRGKGGAGA
ncbi:MAG: helix-turn-helix transcriptional regulator [Actinomycetota bacterium]|nr:helix-turn-helix transcriptional regulator [Actinomycetota bacterium]